MFAFVIGFVLLALKTTAPTIEGRGGKMIVESGEHRLLVLEDEDQDLWLADALVDVMIRERIVMRR